MSGIIDAVVGTRSGTVGKIKGLNFIPSDVETAVTKGNMYYDLSEKRLKHHNGSDWLAVNKTINYDRPGDGHYDVDSFTKLLIQSKTTDGITTFTDTAQGISVTAAGGTTHNTAAKKIGTSSITFDGTNNVLEVGTISNIGFGTGDFVIDFWYNCLSNTGTSELGTVIISQEAANQNDSAWWLRWHVTTAATATLQLAGNYSSTQTLHNGTAMGVTANTWHHFAALRSGTTTYIFKDGTLDSTGSNLNGYNFSASLDADGLVIGARQSTYVQFLNGQLDELRVSVGTDRGWTSGFSVY